MKSFIRAGSDTKNKRKVPEHTSLLSGTKDWKLTVDYTTAPSIFPPEIYPTDERPDLVLWSPSLKRVVLLELTCPAEEGIDNARIRKKKRYNDLLEDINKTNNAWTAMLFTLEVGARGYIAKSVRYCFRRLGLPNRQINSLLKHLAKIVTRCSYAIYLSRRSPWDKNRILLE